MKILRNILWVLFPIAFVAYLLFLWFGLIKTLFIANLALAIILCLPITACLVQTLMNREKNSSNNQFILKMVLITYLYIMVFFLFISVR